MRTGQCASPRSRRRWSPRRLRPKRPATGRNGSASLIRISGSRSTSAPIVHQSYTIGQEKFVNIEVCERARPGEKIGARCSSFNFVVADFGDDVILDAPGLLKAHAEQIASGGLNDFKLVKNRALTFQGLPAREVIITFTIAYFHTPVRNL